MPENEITIKLSNAQVKEVLRKAAGANGSPELSDHGLQGRSLRVTPGSMDDPRFSRSLLRALMVLASYPPDGTPRSVSDVARQVGMGISTAHRYTSTFAEVGVLERDPVSRQYRMASNGPG